jgi:hypothetical protein
MKSSLSKELEEYRVPSKEGQDFLGELESTLDQDLWKSAGGHWSEESIQKFRQLSMMKLNFFLKGNSRESYKEAWQEVVRDFHSDFWGERRLAKKEKKPVTEEKKIFWELFSYIWMMLQATLVTKTAVFYFGIKSASEDSSEGKIYVVLAILFSFVSLLWFAYRKSKKSG